MRLAFAIVSLLLFTNAYADEVLLVNGDRLTGTVVRKEGDELIFKTRYAGELKIAWSQIARVQTKEAMRLILSDQRIVQATRIGAAPQTKRKDSASEGNAQTAADLSLQPAVPATTTGSREPTNGGVAHPQSVPVDTVAYINTGAGIDVLGVRWKGRLNIGGSGNRGNSDTDTLRIDGEAVARLQRNRWTLKGSYDRVTDRDTLAASNRRFSGKYDLFIRERWYGYALAAFEQDRFRDIDLRTTAGFGIGHQMADTERMHLSFEAGLHYVHTDFDRTSDEEYPAVRWATKYDQRLFGSDFQVFHNHEILTDLLEPEQTLIRLQTGLRLPLLQRLLATAQYNIDYDNAPAAGKGRSDRVYLFTVGYAW